MGSSEKGVGVRKREEVAVCVGSPKKEGIAVSMHIYVRYP